MTLNSPISKYPPHLSLSAAAILCFHILVFQLHPVTSLSAGSTVAAVYSTNTICGIVAGESNRRIECFSNGQRVFVQPNISYDSIAGGRSFFCGLRSGGYSLLCWDTGTFLPKRIYFNSVVKLREISIGDDQVCAVANSTNVVTCWRGIAGIQRNQFRSISSGLGFSCGILVNGSRVSCWGSNSAIASSIQNQFGNSSMSEIVAGGSHVCGLQSSDGSLLCKGSNSSGQLGFPGAESFSQLALGFDFSCGIRSLNRTVSCWGGSNHHYNTNSTNGVSFELITAGSDFVCGLVSINFSVICWGPGWSGNDLNLSMILPGPCVQSSCQCGVYPESQKLCSGSGLICSPCNDLFSPPSPSSPFSTSSSSPSRPLRRGLLAFAIVGSVGALAGICTVIYCLYMGTICGRKKIHNSVQPQISRGGSNGGRLSSNSPPSRSIRRQASRAMRRQRSGTSSMKHPDTAEEFTFSELAKATENFSIENKIGAGSFGVVYRGKLSDGREVAIKRGETGPKTKKFQEKENAFESELSFLSRLHHKHLVRLVGFCEERDERLLVYDFMKNGSLYDHLHDKRTFVSSWKMRIKIALDASRGIEYLHNYAVPPIIHRDIKSSNILLDATWTARVSDFGLSLMGPEFDSDSRPLKAAGTVGYIDPEYYGLNVLTAKSDVYGFGVVLLEILTGKKAIFRVDESEDPITVVDFAVPAIMAGDLERILDPRAGPVSQNEGEAVELVAYTAMHCVHLEGKDRLTMTDIVANLERALTLCEESHGSMSSASISIASD